MHKIGPDVPVIKQHPMTAMPRGGDIPLLHPGQILVEDFMRPQKLSSRALAEALQVSHTRIATITRGSTAISADTALRLAHYFDTSPWFWMNLQVRFDLQLAERQVPHPAERIAPLPALEDAGEAPMQGSKEWGVW
ncbi:HigA family addiction module antitoxin [Stenotrophomonas sp. PS02289]|uniref:HigA family addiction module antitoxin n=1 Tax=Stenotrophomonas sp. PS02289 TaxID=2991422 RepID=UPI00249CB6A1|nr:HigA family addiction module antitoxin [Stenotrophomonas sp. PS02289]